MNTQSNPSGLTPISWKPHTLSAIELGEDRKGLIGRAVPILISGVEVIVLCRTAEQLEAVYWHLNREVGAPPAFDHGQVLRATLISSDGIEVIVEPDDSKTVTNVEASDSENAFAAKVDNGATATPFDGFDVAIEEMGRSAKCFEAIIDTPVDDDEL